MVAKVPSIKVSCLVCFKNVWKKPSRVKTFKTCSKECFRIYMKGHKPFNYKGGKLIHKGYVYVLAKGHPNGDRDGYVPEHRLKIEEKIGRYLTSEEVVHHLNGKRGDNRIENLELIKSQSDHIKIHILDGSFVNKGVHPWIGRKHSEETKRRWRILRKGIRPMKGLKLV